jgi:hypothetical protein
VLIDKFGLRPWEIGRLSKRQIQEFYFYPRDENGCLAPPRKPVTEAERLAYSEPPASLEAELEKLAALHAGTGGGEGRGLANYAECVEAVKSRWADGSRQRMRAEWEAARAERRAAGAKPTGKGGPDDRPQRPDA